MQLNGLQPFKPVITFSNDLYIIILLQIFSYNAPGQWFVINKNYIHIV